MAGSLRFSIFLCSFVFVFSKEPHSKLNLEYKDRDPKGFMNLFNNEEPFTENDRFARHVKAVTETVLEHLLNEIKEQYFSANYNSNSPIPRLIRNLNKELKRNERNKLMKEKEKRKNASKKKNKMGKRKQKLTTARTTY
ncbi:uncharacterized protein LOC113497473 [Trichoplusia ni]|uniref:Uncharacterized protein LOC113497473 n=1 Tax=Trichoplusia ni TaxID=7111 RepID=A0A7E5VX63_TRINI|nr:uncharacterized protein LOC113497473 [Trichoplusia ni]